MTSPAYTPMAVPADLEGTALRVLWRGTPDPAQQMQVMIRASRAIEQRCRRRLTPFTGMVQTETAEGVDRTLYGYEGPLPLAGALSRDQAMAFGSGTSVRDLWLDQFAPCWPELWTYSDVSVTLVRAWGDQQILTQEMLEGPHADTGHLRLPAGVFCPVGTIIRSLYSGGYTVAVPDELRDATLLQATKMLILRMEPQNRPGMDTDDLDGEITSLLAAYAN
jgi:hypothetical protein